jgi:hypothetical protein
MMTEQFTRDAALTKLSQEFWAPDYALNQPMYVIKPRQHVTIAADSIVIADNFGWKDSVAPNRPTLSMIREQFEKAIKSGMQGFSVTPITPISELALLPEPRGMSTHHKVQSFTITLSEGAKEADFQQILTNIKQQLALKTDFKRMDMMPHTHTWPHGHSNEPLEQVLDNLEENAKRLIAVQPTELPDHVKSSMREFQSALDKMVTLLHSNENNRQNSPESYEQEERVFTNALRGKRDGFTSMSEVVQAKRRSVGDDGPMPLKTR